MSVVSDESSAGLRVRVRHAIRDVPDFPARGILFRDITPLFGDASLFRDVTEAMAAWYGSEHITHVAAIESRGFILAAPIAQHLHAAFIPIRKRGKLPSRTISRRYGLEYGTDELEIHVDACPPGSRVLIVDDVLATGGTAAAAAELVKEVGGEVIGFAFLLALEELHGVALLERFRSEVLLRL